MGIDYLCASMYKIIAHIKRLLTEHDKVIVPGLGVFGLTYSPASIENGEIIPPSKQLYFEDTPQPNDGLLVKTIIKSEKSDYVSANALIEKEISALKKAIDNSESKSISLNGLGELHRTQSGSLYLNAVAEHPFFMDGYGYGSIPLTPVLNSFSKEEKTENENTRIEISLHRDFVHKIATIAAVLLFILAFPAQIENRKATTNYAGIILPIAETQKEANVVISENDSIPEENTVTAQETVEIKADDTVVQKQYHIIISSLPSRKIAETQIEKFTQSGLSPLTIIERDDKIRLSVRHFDTLDEATIFLKEFKTTHPELSDAWILTVR